MALGIVQMLTDRPAEGLRECEQALVLNRNLAEAHAWAGMAKYFLGRGAETEAHVSDALRLSPRDSRAFLWMQFVGVANIQAGIDPEAVHWLRRCLEANRNHPLAYFQLAAALALLGELDQAKLAVRAGLNLDSTFTIRRLHASVSSNNAGYLAGRERLTKGMRMAGVPEG
jgi:tetratricopeptide (TPR) repeat protein